MKQLDTIKVLREWDQKGRYIFTKHELAKLFPNDNAKAFTEGLSRLVKAGILKRVCRNIYLNPFAHSKSGYILEDIAKSLRQGQYNYISLESALSEYGVISQIPIDRLTIMTTGRKGVYKTPFGVVEFTHTKREINDIIDNSQKLENRPLKIANKMTAWRDLKRVGRNLTMVNKEELNDD